MYWDAIHCCNHWLRSGTADICHGSRWHTVTVCHIRKIFTVYRVYLIISKCKYVQRHLRAPTRDREAGKLWICFLKIIAMSRPNDIVTVPFRLIRAVTHRRAFCLARILAHVPRHTDFGRMWQLVQKNGFKMKKKSSFFELILRICAQNIFYSTVDHSGCTWTI